ncbi:MAG: DoxX family protein, partial [Cytophagia bacterium]|nr:DoxX family protein [Cytophagia bacterium]
QSLLAAMFLMAGANKLFQSIPELSKMLPWVVTVPEGLVRFIGISELLGGIGLLLPGILKIKPTLTVWAAIGLAVIMFLASFFHISRGETSLISMNFIFMGLALFVAWGRTKKVPISAKG